MLLAGGAQHAKMMSALESLAAWKDVDVVRMAKTLISMTPEARTDLRRSYAAALQLG